MQGVLSWVLVAALLVPHLCALAPLPNSRTDAEVSWRLASRARGGAVKAGRDVDEDGKLVSHKSILPLVSHSQAEVVYLQTPIRWAAQPEFIQQS